MMTETHTVSAIRHIATSVRGDTVAVALFERTVSLWNLATGERLSEFQTILDFGGTRLALSQAESACLTAAYHVHGLACYDTPSGRLRWQRKDLKKIQQIVVTPDGRQVYCCFDERQCQVLSVSTGETIERVRALHHVWMDSRGAFQLHKSGKLTVVSRDKEKLFEIVPNSFAVLDAAFSRTHLAISEAGADVRVFDLSTGQETVRHRQPEGHHVLEMSLSPDDCVFHGTQRDYRKGGPKFLLRFGPDSREPEIIRSLGKTREAAFCHEGRHLLTSEGELIDCQSGEKVKKLPFPQWST